MKLINYLRKKDFIFLIILLSMVTGIIVSIYFCKLSLKNSGSMYIGEGEYYSGADESSNDRSLQKNILNDRDNSKWANFGIPGAPAQRADSHSTWIRIKLPEGLWAEPCLLFRTAQQDVRVYMEDKLIYSFGSMDLSNRKIAPGSTWNFVMLPEGFQGKTVHINLYSPFPEYAGYMDEVQIGSHNVLILKILKEYIDYIILGCIFIFIGIAMGLIYFISKKVEVAFLAIGLSSTFIGLWVIAESKITQFFLDAPILWMYLAYGAIFLMPAGLCIFIHRFFGERNKSIFKKLWMSYIYFAVLAFALELTHTVSLFTSVKLFHVMLVISMAISVVTIVRAAKNGNKEAVVFSFGIIVLCLAGIHDIISLFYTKIVWLRAQRFTQWGMFYFVITIIYILGRRIVDFYDNIEISSRENETNYRSLFENMIDGFVYSRVIFDDNNNPVDYVILEANEAFEKQIGFHRKNVIGKRIVEVISDIQKSETDWINKFGKVALSGGKIEFNNPVMHLGKWYNISAFSQKKGYLCIILKDITANKQAEEVIKYQAFHDSVTGIYNRMYFEDEIARLSREISSLDSLSMISIDLDGLKIINDTFGHNTGDNVLKEAAGIISCVLKKNETAARVGGDEFCIILPNVDNEAANKKMEQLVKQIEEYNKNSPFIPISMSLGTATYDSSIDRDLYNMYKRADDNMYAYKLSQSRNMKSNVIDMLLTALSQRDYASEGHVERLVNMSELMADRLELTDTQRRNLILLAKMHDLGKIGIPDEILFKPGRLTDEEYKKMKEHAEIGYSIANRTNGLSHIASLILHHHEFWDGKGYPGGLKEEKIPLECRVLAVIDAYDAMTSKRAYRSGITREEAVVELRRCSGTQFDPLLVKEFISIIKN